MAPVRREEYTGDPDAEFRADGAITVLWALGVQLVLWRERAGHGSFEHAVLKGR